MTDPIGPCKDHVQAKACTGTTRSYFCTVLPIAEGKGVEPMGAALRDLRALRYDPPGHAKAGARRTTFQSALEQCEQFLAAARDAGYATRPVQLFYALSQAGRALVAASPRIGNQAWRVSGHGLTANTNAATVADIAVTATNAGLFPSVAAALGIGCLVPGAPVALRELWPLLPESVLVPLTADALLPVLMFSQAGWPEATVFTGAQIGWIPGRVKDLYGDDPARVQEHLILYPALKECTLRLSQGGVVEPRPWAVPERPVAQRISAAEAS